MPRLADEQARRLLARWVAPPTVPAVVGEGMEGVVYALDEQRVAKVWFTASPEALRRTSRFQAALAAAPFTFSTPRILEVAAVDGHSVTIEQRLGGTPLTVLRDRGAVGATQAIFVDVLAELAAGGPLPEARDLPVLGEPVPFQPGATDFPVALAALLARRVQRSRDVLDAAVPDLARYLEVLPVRLGEVDSGRRTVVHGDLILANILVDEDARPAAVLDWGFLTAEGDPAFDAAVAAAIFDMYGDDALRTELALHDRLVERLGHDRGALLVYRAAYSLITATAYDPAGRDGHFAWCVRALARPDVRAAVFG